MSQRDSYHLIERLLLLSLAATLSAVLFFSLSDPSEPPMESEARGEAGLAVFEMHQPPPLPKRLYDAAINWLGKHGF